MLETPKIYFTKTNENAELPHRENISDPGYLFKATEDITIPSRNQIKISTNLIIEDIVRGVWGLIMPTDALNEEYEVFPLTKIINNTFRGELKICLYNASENDYTLKKGEVYARIVYMPLLTIEPELKKHE